MRILGLEIGFAKAAPATLSPIWSSWWSGFCGRIAESFSGAWQRNIEIKQEVVTAYWAVFACATAIAGDISKLGVWVMEEKDNIWVKTKLRPVLRKPNRYQTRLEFIFGWVISQLFHGNTYVLKQRDEKGHVVALYILDPTRVMPLVTPDGSVYYQLSPDNVGNVESAITVPAKEIIHDRMYPLFHPLIGVSPLYACGSAAMQGSAIQSNSTKFFGNASRPSGIITVPGQLTDDKAAMIKATWESGYTGANAGKTAVLADDMKYAPLSVSAHDSQLIEQLKMTAEMVCACFHVPGYKIGVGQMPTVNNTGQLNQQYYDQCLQYIIEKMELRLDEGLELADGFETAFDLSGLMRMDPEARYKSHNEAIKGSWKSPNECRQEEDLKPVAGGDSPMAQQQNYSLAALAKRDALPDPFAKSNGTPAADPPPDPETVKAVNDELAAIFKGELENVRYA